SGHRHTVVTGVKFRDTHGMHTIAARREVWFRPLTDEEIAYYVATYRPFDKAGSYGVQEWIGYVAIERIDGSFYNVMGLPIQKVYTELDKFLDR
ncbi:MAG: Maf family protein, partial [Alistipes sp.]|nr:Maf family protein [Alistipes sp.]